MKLTIKKKAIIALLSASLSFPTFAATPNQNPAATGTAVELGLLLTAIVGMEAIDLMDLREKEAISYVAGDFGSASYGNAFGSNGNSPFPNAQTMRIAGGYSFYKRGDPDAVIFSFEAGYTNLGNSIIDYGAQGRDTLHGSSVQASFIVAYPVTHGFDLTGKIGYASTKTSMLTSITGKPNVDGSNSHVLYGLGMQYHFDAHYIVRAQYENLGAIDRTANPAKASVISAGLAYEF